MARASAIATDDVDGAIGVLCNLGRDASDQEPAQAPATVRAHDDAGRPLRAGGLDHAGRRVPHPDQDLRPDASRSDAPDDRLRGRLARSTGLIDPLAKATSRSAQPAGVDGVDDHEWHPGFGRHADRDPLRRHRHVAELGCQHHRPARSSRGSAIHRPGGRAGAGSLWSHPNGYDGLRHVANLGPCSHHGGRAGWPERPGPDVTNDGPAYAARMLDPTVSAQDAGSSFESSPDATALAALDQAARAIASVGNLEEVLQLIVDRVRDLVHASYAALGIAGADGHMERFITSGIDAQRRHAIGPLPEGRGLLGLIIREARSYRIPSIADHRDSSGFPPNHPPMTSFLGVPISANGASIGNFYLTDKIGATEFSPADQRLVELFARHAWIAIDNARLHGQARRLAVTEERDRIGRDLHDGIIQSLYAVALSLEDALESMTESPADAAGQVDAAIESINLSIRDIRNFIYGLRPEAADGSQLVAGLAALAEELRHGGLVDVHVDLDPTADPELTADAGIEVLHLVREALSNAARHARPKRISLELRPSLDGSVLEIADDGIGFDPDRDRGASHHGLGNMRARAEAIDGHLAIRSAPGSGTRITLTLPPRSGARR